ncbi:MFS transporter [Krasilnikoviella flava]|uniref:Major Facilitator Superfamily protein n=1 Tax=Krasilnikoviella flava TaxID=526729 RepID=A0A1T5IPJ2_9MICO|nr:MFS transporter [Krasilnikoviella flava]SKC41061.1 Major Facilitator Superfamily protein [Krasilnikoviella flava]
MSRPATAAAASRPASAAAARPPGRPAPRELAVLVVVSGAIFLEGSDIGMLNVALPAIRADLGLSTAALSGIVSAYVLGYGGFMLLGGRAADLLGRRRMFLAWLAVFLVFSGLGGFADDGGVLLLARFVTGVAAAFLTPAGLSILTTTFPEGPRRDRAVLVYSGIAAGGFSLGVVAGGLLAAVGWRWVFFAPVVLAALLLVAAVRVLPRDAARTATRSGFDLTGAVTITAGMLLVVYGVVRLEHPRDGVLTTVGVLAGGAALLAVFVAVERRSTAPLVRLGILRSSALVRANLGAALLTAAFFGFQFVVTLYLQELRGWSSLETGLALLVLGADVVLAPLLTPVLVRRFGNVRVVAGGFVIAAVAYVIFLGVGADWPYAAMLPSFALVALAIGLTYGPLVSAATDGVRAEEQGLAGGLVNTSFQLGAALGISGVTAVQVAALGSATSSDALLESYRAALVVPAAAAALGVVVAVVGVRAARAR